MYLEVHLGDFNNFSKCIKSQTLAGKLNFWISNWGTIGRIPFDKLRTSSKQTSDYTDLNLSLSWKFKENIQIKLKVKPPHIYFLRQTIETHDDNACHGVGKCFPKFVMAISRIWQKLYFCKFSVKQYYFYEHHSSEREKSSKDIEWFQTQVWIVLMEQVILILMIFNANQKNRL